MVEQASHQISAGKTAVVVGAGLAACSPRPHCRTFSRMSSSLSATDCQRVQGCAKGCRKARTRPYALGYAVEAFDQLVPGMIGRLYEAGAVRIRRNQDIWFHDMVGPTPIRDVGILTPSVTRPLLEYVAGNLIFRKPNVTLREGTRLVSFLSDAARNVCGVAINQ